MKLAVISMIRDEADIIVPFLGHLAALFDIAFLLDQRSSDGTGEIMREACSNRSGWAYHYMDFSGRHQKEVSTHFLARAFAAGADAVFFLDSDEFVDVRSRAALVDMAARLQEASALGSLPWRNGVPERFDRWAFDPAKPLWIAGEDGTHSKIAVPRSLFERFPDIRLTQGNHDAVRPGEGSRLARLECGPLLHIPVRSKQQLQQKIFLSAIANYAKHNPMVGEGSHKRRLLEIVADRDLSDAVLMSIAAQFPVMNGVDWWHDFRALGRAGFIRRRAPLLVARISSSAPPRPDLARLIARALRDFRLEDVAGDQGTLEFEGEICRFRPRGQAAVP